MKICKHLSTEPTCLLRQLAEGTASEDSSRCGHCDATISELEITDDSIKRAATELASIEAEAGYQRAAVLARNAWTTGTSTSDVENSGDGSTLWIRCPNCGSQSALANESTVNNFACSTCGEPIQIVKDDRTSVQANEMLGHFRLVEKVGQGSFGVVWRADDTQLDRVVAIKIPRREQLSSSEVESFINEARASASLKHPNILAVHEIGRDRDSVYIVSDFVDGLTLEELLTERLLSVRDSANLCATIAEALHHAHEQGVVHRDLKPGNIAVDSSLSPTIMDFGLALRTSTELTMSADGKILGTPAYMSPEQARGESNSADQRSDIYSLGVVLFQMLTGERPFRGNIRMLLNQIMHDEPMNPQRLNGSVPRDLATICLKCLQKAPERRYPTGQALADDLRNFLDGRPISARPVSSLERGWRWCRRNPLPSTLAALLVVSLIAGTVVSSWKWIEAENAAEQSRVSAEKARAAATQSNVAGKRAGDILKIVVDAFAAVNPLAGADASMSAKDVLLEVQSNLESSDLDDLGRMRLSGILANSFLRIGEVEASVVAAEKALELYRKHLGDSDPKTLTSMNNLVSSYLSAGQLDKATELSETALRLHREHASDNYDRIVYALQNQGAILERTGKLEEALALKEETLELCRSQFGDESEHTLGSMNELAFAYESAGKFEDALSMYDEALQLLIAMLGDDHPATLTLMNNKAGALESLGRIDQALELYKDTLSRRQVKLGEDHPETLGALSNLAFTYMSAERLNEALPLFAKALAGLRKSIGDDHPDTLNCIMAYAGALDKSGDLPTALPLYEESLSGFRAKFGFEHPRTWSSASALSDALVRLDRADEAVSLLTELAKSVRQRLGDHAATIATLQQLAMAYESANDLGTAEKLLRRSLKTSETIQPTSWITYDGYSQLAGVLMKRGEMEEAAKLLEGAYAGLAGIKEIRQQHPVVWCGSGPFEREVRTRMLTRLVRLAKTQKDVDQASKWQSEIDALQK